MEGQFVYPPGRRAASALAKKRRTIYNAGRQSLLSKPDEGLAKENSVIEEALLEESHLSETQRELLYISWRMLNAIHTGDAETYSGTSHARPVLL